MNLTIVKASGKRVRLTKISCVEFEGDSIKVMPFPPNGVRVADESLPYLLRGEAYIPPVTCIAIPGFTWSMGLTGYRNSENFSSYIDKA